MNLNDLSSALAAITKQQTINGIKAGLAIVACTFLYLEMQARFVTPAMRKRILSRVPLVVAGGLGFIALSSWLSSHYKLFASLKFLQTGGVAIGVIFTIVCGLFAYGVHGIMHGDILPRTKQIIGAVLATAAVVCFFLFFHLSYKGYYHRWELFHYYMGSKYARELQYERIYVCSAIADNETGNNKDVKRRKMRDLRVNLLVPSKEIIAQPEMCKDHFTPERWEAFKTDLKFFRKVSGRRYWNDMQKDHGYNPPPVWTVAGHYLSMLQPAADGYFKLLSAIDVTLSALLFIAIGWAFGWRVLVVAALFWGTQEPAPFYWTGGAFLRQDWFFLSVLAACLARKRYFFWAGVALTYASLLRVFPVLLWAGPLLIMAIELIRHRQLLLRFIKSKGKGMEDAPRRMARGMLSKYGRLMGGAAAAAVILFALSVHVAGFGAYKEFFHHIGVHQNTPLTNHVGLKTVVATAPTGRMKYTRDNRLVDPFERWKDGRRDRFKMLKPLHYGIILLFGAGLLWALLRINSLWVGMGLSLIFVVSFVEATCYYYSVWIFAALLTRAKRSMEWPLAAVFLGIFVYLFYKIFQRLINLSDGVTLVLAVGACGLLYYYFQESIHSFAKAKGSMDIAVIGLGGASQLLTVQFYFIDDKFTAISALYVVWTAAFVLAFVRPPPMFAAVDPAPIPERAGS